jgi:uncharacterized protein HemX
MSFVRPATRSLRSTAAKAPRRFYATPGAEPNVTRPNTNPPSSGGGGNTTLLLVAAAAVAAGGGYWYMNSTGKDEDVKKKAKELRDAGEAKRKALQKEGEAKLETAKVRVIDRLFACILV